MHLQPILSQLHAKVLDDVEKALGIVKIKKPPGMNLRNWLGYKLREQILLFERSAYHQSKVLTMDLFKAKFNQAVAREIKHLMYRFKNEGRLAQFDKIVAFKGILCEKRERRNIALKKISDNYRICFP